MLFNFNLYVADNNLTMRFYSIFLYFYKSKFIVDYVYFIIHIAIIIKIKLIFL